MTWNRFTSTCLVLVTCVTVSMFAIAQDNPPASDTPPAAEMKKPANVGSYYIGLSIGEQFRSQGVEPADIDVESLAMGIADELANVAPRLTDEELAAAAEAVQAMMTKRQTAAREKMQAEMEAAALANLEKADLFLEENKKKEGVKVLASGLQYKVERAGNGPSPKLANTVKVHYTGRLLNGEIFDSSVQRGQPAEFPINGLIEGWKEALPRMKVGDKWTLYVPPAMAYGARGSAPVIGPNELLVFEMELLDIVK
jgi:FKBP-type peptidyl-prolyl cis-trans isomerase